MNAHRNDVSFVLSIIRWTTVNTSDRQRLSTLSESSGYFVAEEKRFVISTHVDDTSQAISIFTLSCPYEFLFVGYTITEGGGVVGRVWSSG